MQISFDRLLEHFHFDKESNSCVLANIKFMEDSHCSVAISSTEVLVIGGYYTPYISAMEKYDINWNHIKTLPSMELARAVSGCVVYNNEVYVTGGLGSAWLLNSVEMYNLQSIWRIWCSGTNINGSILWNQLDRR